MSDFPDFTEKSGFFMRLRKPMLGILKKEKKPAFLLAFSGGADSMCLLWFLTWLRKREKVQIFAAHYNHQLRPGADEQESTLIRALCRELCIPLYEEEGDIRKLAAQRGRGTEEAARFARHVFLEKTRKGLEEQLNIQVLTALAHNMNDQAETLLLNMGRGSGLSGLSGMPYCADHKIRPLLYTSRCEIEHFLESRKLTWCRDATNEEDDYARNKVRHHLLPFWSELAGCDVIPALSALAGNLAEENEYLESQAAAAAERLTLESGALNLRGFADIHRGLWFRVINRWINIRRKDRGLEERALTRRQYQDLLNKLERLPAEADFDIGENQRLMIRQYCMYLKDL